MDVTDIVDYNLGLLNQNDLANSFFCLSKTDPTAGFVFDPSTVAGHTFPEPSTTPGKPDTRHLAAERTPGQNVELGLAQP